MCSNNNSFFIWRWIDNRTNIWYQSQKYHTGKNKSGQSKLSMKTINIDLYGVHLFQMVVLEKAISFLLIIVNHVNHFHFTYYAKKAIAVWPFVTDRIDILNIHTSKTRLFSIFRKIPGVKPSLDSIFSFFFSWWQCRTVHRLCILSHQSLI